MGMSENEHPYDEVRNHINEEEWKYLLKLRRYVSCCQQSHGPSEPALSNDVILTDLINGYWL